MQGPRQAPVRTPAGDHGAHARPGRRQTLKPPSAGLTHWSTRELAAEVGVSHTTVHRIWKAHDLQPHRVETFKCSSDPDAEDKIHDVVGLYMNPPTNAVVLSVDEKTQIKALNAAHSAAAPRPACAPDP